MRKKSSRTGLMLTINQISIVTQQITDSGSVAAVALIEACVLPIAEICSIMQQQEN